MAFLPDSPRRQRSFDFFGFAMLSLAIGALQLMLDRGEQIDWFSSPETWIYLGLVLSGAWAFVLHITSGREHPFMEPAMFRDTHFATALVMIFMVGMILLAGLALLPPMLQNLYGYPVISTGMVLAPRGVGTMISMIVVGRLVGKVDARLLIFTGLALTAYSLWQMTAFSPQMDWRPLVVSGVVQGLGLGLVFVPLSTLAFATLEPKFRAEAAALFSLVRNIGSSIGISIVATELSHNLVAARTDLASQLTAANPNLDGYFAAAGGATPTALAQLGNLVQAQAAMVAYIDDFMLMFWLTLAAMPLIFLLRKPGVPVGGDAHAAAVME